MERSKALSVANTIAGCFLLATTANAAGVLLPRNGAAPIGIRSHRVMARVEDGIARTQVRQVFVNPHSRALEAVYSFPLPEDASIVELTMIVGEQRLEGLLVERREARRVYDSLVGRKKDPALLEQVGRSEYQLSIFPVLPAVETVIELTYVEPCPTIAGEARYVYPLASQGNAASVDQDLTAIVEFASSARLLAIESKNEGMSTSLRGPREGRASFEKTKASLGEDLVVVAKVAVDEPTLAVHTYRAPGGDAFFAAVVTAPRLSDDAVIPRDFTFVLDVSGSMQGEKFDQARRSVLWWIENLGPRDRANLVLFSDVMSRFADAPVDATPENRRALTAYLAAAKTGGGTDIEAAVRAAGEHRASDDRMAVAVVLTDGRPTSGALMLAEIVKRAREAGDDRVAIHAFGIGNDVDPILLDGIATSAHGASEVLRTVGDVEERLRAFLTRIGAPAMRGSGLRIDDRKIDETFPRAPYTVFSGEQFVIAGRTPATGELPIAFDVVFGDATLSLRANADFGSAESSTSSGSIVARDLYAKQRLASLERVHRLRLGLDDAAYHAAVGAGRYDTKDELVAAMIDVSLETGVQCAYTSFLALLPEDRQRLHPRDVTAVDEALKRVAERRRVLASAADPNFEPKAVANDDTASIDQASDAGPDTAGASSSSGGFVLGSGKKSNGGGGGGPSTPGGGPSGGGTPGPTTGGGGIGKKASRSSNFDSWEFWWEHNQERFFDDLWLRPTRPTADEVRGRIVPILKSVLHEDDGDLVDAAVFSLGRIVLEDDAALCFDDLVHALGNRYASVRQSAILALGALGSRNAIPVLTVILRDSEHARTMLAMRGPIPILERSYSAIALGQLGATESIPELIAVFRSLDSGANELRASIVFALGLFSEHKDPIADFLLEMLTDPTLDENVLGQIPIALSRIGDTSAVPRLLELVTDSKTKARLEESAILALGRLAAPSDGTVLDALRRKIGSGQNGQARHFAILALGEIAARAIRENLPSRDEFVAEVMTTLLAELRKARNKNHEPWAGFALAILGRELPSSSMERAQIARGLTEKFDAETNLTYLPAYALALGILDVETAAPMVMKTMLETNALIVKSHCAVALGLLRHDAAIPSLRKYVLDDRDPFLRMSAAMALGLLRDVDATNLLTESIGKAKTLAQISSLARALGLVGDARAVDPLEALIRNRSATGLARGFGCVALGWLADKNRMPWTERVSIGANYRTKLPALEVLNLNYFH